MNQFLNKLERKFGRYAIHNLMKYIIGLYILGYVVWILNPMIYAEYLTMDVTKLFQGQIWRIVTFMIQPATSMNPISILITLYLYYMIGNALENAWGAFRFNLYFLSGILFNIVGCIIFYLITGLSLPISLEYINQSMFFAYAALYPNMQLLLMFIIPIKVKWLGILEGLILAYEMFYFATHNFILYDVVIMFALANFIIFFLSTRNYRRISPSEIRRKQNYKRQTRQISYGNVTQFKGKNVVTRHKCAVCGRTELDDENLEFRFCSKCDGNYEYCMDHLFTHEHVKK